MNRIHRISRALTLAALLLVAAAPGAAFANMANPYNAGDPVGEPFGQLKNIAIEHEALKIDARPLANDAPALVSATYDVRNDGAATNLDLQFVATALSNETARQKAQTGVQFDGQGVPVSVGSLATLPPSWKPPTTTPGLAGHDPLSYRTHSNRAINFTVTVPPGQHHIQVQYPATASSYSLDSPVRFWQLGYVLAPAKNWASFGKLDVEVDLPSGWSGATEPALTRQGDVLRGSFNGIPADSLALTFQAPVPVTSTFNWLGIAFAAGLVLAVFLGVVAGRWLGRRGRSAWWALIPSAVGAVGWSFLLVVATALSDSPLTVPDGQAAWTYNYGLGFEMIALVFIALPLGLVVTLVSALLARRGSQRRTTSPA